MNFTCERLGDDVTLYRGDCLEVMETEDIHVDAVITDPPYGINAKTGWSRNLYNDIAEVWNNGSITNDSNTFMRDYIVSWCINNNLPAAIFGTYKIDKPKGWKGVLVWDKGGSSGMGDLSFPWKPNWEEIYIFGNGWKGKRETSIISVNNIPRISMGRRHPHEKPPELIKHIINKLPKTLTILDPFMGSGTTGVACVQTGRKFIGIEIDESYYNIAKKRIQEAQLQMRLPL